MMRRDVQSFACLIGLLPPANITLRTRFLRSDIRIELLIGSLLIDTDALRFLPVGIVLNRSTTVERALVHIVWQLDYHAEAQHIGHLC